MARVSRDSQFLHPTGGQPTFVFDPDLVTFTPAMDKRISPGPFYTAPIVQGKWDGTGTPGVVTFPRGDQVGNATEVRYANFDPYQGSIVFWITPEWDGDDGIEHIVLRPDLGAIQIYKTTSGYLRGLFRTSGGTIVDANVDVTAWVAGNTYCIVFSWDVKNTVDGTNYVRLSVNNAHSYGGPEGDGTAEDTASVINFGQGSDLKASDAIIEGLTVYRRVLTDDNGYGTLPQTGNPYQLPSTDELTEIYNAGSGRDPTEVTGSEDVCFCLPTDSTAEALTTGTGEAWSWPWGDNLPDVHGMWDGGLPGTDYAVEFNGTSTLINCGSGATLDDIPSGGEITVGVWVRIDSASTVPRIITKGPFGSGWQLWVNASGQVRFTVWCADGAASSWYTTKSIDDGKFHYVVGYYNDTTKRSYTAVDGDWSSHATGSGAYEADAAYDLIIGSNEAGGAQDLDGAIAWAAIWDDDHHTAGTDFIPPRTAPTPGGNLVECWHMDEGTGATAAAQVTSPGNDGTITDGAWSSIWEQDGSPVIPYSLEFDGAATVVNCGSAADIDDVPDGGAITVEAWVRLGASGDHTVLSKQPSGAGWALYFSAAGFLIFRAEYDTTDAFVSVGNDWADGRYHHVVGTYDEGGDRLARLWIDGLLVRTAAAASAGNYVSDAAASLYIGRNAYGASGFYDGGIAWARISDSIRYTGTFVPPDRLNPPAVDGNTLRQFNFRDGAGATLTDATGTANGTITFGDGYWNTTPDMAIDEPGARVYNGGYNVGVDAAGEGVYIEQAVTAGDDYVVFPVLAIDQDGRARPRIRIRDVTGAADVVTFNGPMLYGTHAGANNQATLQPTSPRWIADALIGATVYNITDGSSATITDNSEGVVTANLAGGTDNDWDTNDVFLIRFDEPYCLHPWAETFCFKVPAGCATLRVFVENINAEGVIQIHQLQVLPNLLANGDHESLQGVNPELITGWANLNLDPGDTQASSGGGGIIHSGAEALQWNVGASNEYMDVDIAGEAAGKFYMGGLWYYGDGSEPVLGGSTSGDRMRFQVGTGNALEPSELAQWKVVWNVFQCVGTPVKCMLYAHSGAAGSRYTDDTWLIELDPVTLTVTPASEANSAEATGLRVDGRDDCQQPIPAGYFAPSFGSIMFNWTPRHDDSDVIDWGNATPHVFWAAGPIANYIELYWTAADNLRLEVQVGGIASSADWATGGGAIVAGTTYAVRVFYTGVSIYLYVDGVLRITVSPAAGIDFTGDIPQGMFWGSNATPAQHVDATFARP